MVRYIASAMTILHHCAMLLRDQVLRIEKAVCREDIAFSNQNAGS